MTFVEIGLGLLFLISFLFLLRYIRSPEGFENPPPETYSLDAFFAEYPVARICPLYNAVFQKLVLTYKTDTTGHPVPDDVAIANATAEIKKTVPNTLCPFPAPPTETDLTTVAAYVNGLDDELLVRASATLTYCETALTKALTDAKAAVATIPAGLLNEGFLLLPTSQEKFHSQSHRLLEGFLTQCGPDELAAAETDRKAIPLQCVVAETMKATDQAAIDAVPPEEQKLRTAQKQAISRKLMSLVKHVVKAEEPSMSERIARAESTKTEMDALEKKVQAL